MWQLLWAYPVTTATAIVGLAFFLYNYFGEKES